MYINVILQWTNTTQGAFKAGEKYLHLSTHTPSESTQKHHLLIVLEA
jgi:hypothetical protein